jgi:hypothetical protein
MTVLFHGTKRSLPPTFVQHRPVGATFDEILYADDTVLLSSDTRSMNRFLAAVEREGAKYGMYLHKHKCHALKFGPPSAVKFADGTPVPSSHQAQYLGCELNITHDTYDEVRRRIRVAAGVLRKAHLFWRRSSATRRFKLQAVSAILYSKILHGLEGAELTGRALQALDTFQLKCLRKVLHMDTTYVTRANTNEEVFRRANAVLQHPSARRPNRPPPQPLRSLSQIYLIRKARFFLQIAQTSPTNPLHSITFEPGSLAPRVHFPKRVGRPKAKWAHSVLTSEWYRVHQYRGTLPEPPFDAHDEDHKETLFTHLRNPVPPAPHR